MKRAIAVLVVLVMVFTYGVALAENSISKVYYDTLLTLETTYNANPKSFAAARIGLFYNTLQMYWHAYSIESCSDFLKLSSFGEDHSIDDIVKMSLRANNMFEATVSEVYTKWLNGEATDAECMDAIMAGVKVAKSMVEGKKGE